VSLNPPLTLSELRLTPEYAALTAKMKIFVDAYIESRGDVIASIQEAYKCKGPREEKIVKWQIMRHPKIMAALEIWSNRDEKEIFVENLKAQLRLKEVPVGKVRLMELYARMMGWDITPEQIKAIAVENNVKVKAKREANITRALDRQIRKDRRQVKKQEEFEPSVGEDQWGLDTYEAQSDGDQGDKPAS